MFHVLKWLLLILVCLCAFLAPSKAQLLRVGVKGDSTQVVTLEGYADIYFGFDFNEPAGRERPYSVSHSRHSETNINLAYLSLRYKSERARAAFTPGFGTYMNANYAQERQTLQNIVEANIGVKPFRRREIWIDAGVFIAPYTTETALAHDQLLYTRSFAAEYSPYYLTGVRATLPLSRGLKICFYLVNGWQVIQDVNDPLAFATSLEWKPGEQTTLAWSTFVGNEQSASSPHYKERFFSDVYFLFTPSGRVSVSANIYAGVQRHGDTINNGNALLWYQANTNVRYYFSGAHSIGLRAEYFRDENAALVAPVTGIRHFDCASISLGYNVSINSHIAFHLEGRYYFSGDEAFLDRHKTASKNDALLVGGLTAKF